MGFIGFVSCFFSLVTFYDAFIDVGVRSFDIGNEIPAMQIYGRSCGSNGVS